MSLPRTIATGLSASLVSIVAYVKPCTLHALNPSGLEAYLTTLLHLSSLSAQIAELGSDIAEGRYQPGSGRLGSLAALVLRETCTRFTTCPHDLVVPLTVYAAAYAAASRRGRVSRDTILSAAMSVIAHTGSKDVEELARVLEATAPREYMAFEEALTSLITVENLDDAARALSQRFPGYTCIARPNECISYAAKLENPFSSSSIVRLWVEMLLPRCAPQAFQEARQAVNDAKKLFTVDLECRRKGLSAKCMRHVSILAVAAFTAAVLP